MASTKQSASSQTAGLTSTDYPSWLTQALTGSTVKGSANPIGGYGFTQDQIKQMQNMGVTVGDLQNLGLGGTSFGQGQPQVGQNQLQNATMLKLMLGQQQQPQGTPGPAQPPSGATVMNPLQLSSQQVQTPQVPQQAPQQMLQPVQQPVVQAPQQQPVSAQNVLNPIPIQVQPVQQYQKGGLVQNYAAQYPNYPNANRAYNPQTDPTGGRGALSNYDFSAYAGNQGAIKELLTSYGVTPTQSQLYMYAKDPQSLGSVMAGGTTGYAPGAGQAYGYSGMGGGMTTTGGIPLGTLMMMRGQGQPQATPAPPPAAPTGPTIMNPLQLPSQQGMQTPQVPQQVPQQVQMPQMPQPVIQAPQQQPLTGQNVLNPIPVQVQPVQQYGSGGLVRRYQSGGMVDPNLNFGGGQGGGQVQQLGPGVTRNAQGQVIYTDPRLQTELGLGDLSTAQQTALGLDPLHAQALSGATKVGALYGANILGGAALYEPAIINLPPSGTPSSKSGVAPTPGAIVGTNIPQTPQGPWLTNPSVFARATPYTPTPAPTVTPQTPATAVAYAPGQPFATPPAAPTALPSALPPAMAQSGATTERPPTAMLPPGFMGGAQGAGYVPQAFLQAHTSALANAGMALYAHAGGDPNSASPEDIANFHRQLTDAVGQHIAANQPAAGVKQAATGGLVTAPGRLVPGRGNKDTVPALLTPGEYVIPKDQVAQLAARGVLRLNSGGEVPDNQSNEPPEARRQGLTVSQPSPSSAQRSSLQGSSLVSGLSQAAQTYGSSMGGGSIGGAGMGGGRDLRNTPLDPDPDTPYLQAAGMGGGGMSSGLKSALGGIGSGLTQASQALAENAKLSWQMQQSAIPDPSQLPKYQTPTLQAQRVA